jgi:hypothetical protein
MMKEMGIRVMMGVGLLVAWLAIWLLVDFFTKTVGG